MKNKKPKYYLIFLVLALITFAAYLVIEIMHYDSFLNFLPKLLGMILIFVFLLCFIIFSTKSKDKKIGTIIIGSLIITVYSIFNILLTLNILNLPSDEIVPNFYNKTISDLITWKEKNNIEIIETYEYSDNIIKDHIISQDVNYPTLTKDIEKMTITISLGPDMEKEVIVPNFIGLKYDDVLKYIEENHLSNVTINYQKDDEKIDIVISQNGSGTMKRNDPISITFGISSEEKEEIEIIDFTNMPLINATSWLNKYNFKVELTYEYSDTIKKDYIINQSSKNEVKNPKEDTITLIVSQGKKTIAPDILAMSVDEINTWITDNDLKITYQEKYSNDIKLGDVIESNIKKDDVVTSGDKIIVTISKGSLKMIKLTNINDFTNWAEQYKIPYDINYEYSDTIKKDQIIKCTHNEGQIIKDDDTVIVTVSKGKSISIPNFVGMSKSNITSKCNSLNLNCSFKSGGYTDKTARDIAINQSKKAGTTVSEGTSLVITLSAGIQEKVNVPSFKNKTKGEIESSCKSIGITCKFTYQSGYSDIKKDTCISQSTTGKVNKGSTVTVTLSNGPATTYTIVIDANQLSSGNPTATKATLEAKLKKACPGVTFKFTYQKANSGIGYLAQNSQVKVGSNKLTQGKTYNVIINSN